MKKMTKIILFTLYFMTLAFLLIYYFVCKSVIAIRLFGIGAVLIVIHGVIKAIINHNKKEL